MKILLYIPSKTADEWHAAFARALPRAELRAWAPGPAWQADYAAFWYPPRELLDGQRRLKAAFNLGAGVDGTLKALTVPPGVPLVRLEDAGMGPQMEAYVGWAVMRYFRRLDEYAEQQARAEWKVHRPRRHEAFAVGVMGLGVLGARVARAMIALGFPVRGWSASAKSVDGVRSFAGGAELPAFLAGIQVLVCLLPLTPDTAGVLNRTTLGKLPRGAYVVNVARGGLVVDDDLLALLDEGHLAGATLDVFREEPLPGSHRFWSHPRVFLTPHCSALTIVEDSVAQVAAKIERLERGEPVTGVVDLARGY
ncbi:MAG TPA: glyoxylate/hydroxypyruvate reductase A [Burkholderiales bacterium]|nr:glyoxylate/hydroxypyruvate reductase A [Burkholderiales bacterium]